MRFKKYSKAKTFALIALLFVTVATSTLTVSTLVLAQNVPVEDRAQKAEQEKTTREIDDLTKSGRAISKEEEAKISFREKFKSSLATAFKTALGGFLNKFAQDSAIWLASGAKGQHPLFEQRGWNQYLTETADAALGVFVEEVGKGLNQLYQDSVAEYQQGQVVEALGEGGQEEYLQLRDQGRQQCSALGSASERESCYGDADTAALNQAYINNNEDAKNGYDNCIDSGGTPSDCVKAVENPLNGISSQATNLGLNELGGVLNAFTGDLCSPSNLNVTLNLSLSLNQAQARGNCTFSQIKDNLRQTVDSAGFTVNFVNYFRPQENDIGIALTLIDRKNTELLRRSQEATVERLANQGFKDVSKGVNGLINTPGQLAREWTAAGFAKLGDKEGAYTGTIADAVGTFVSSLIGAYLNNLASGLVDDSSAQGENFRASGSGFEQLANFSSSPASSGAAGAAVRFQGFKEVDFSGSGAFQIINELATCSNIGNPAPNECVITANFRDAVVDQLTVREAIESGNLDGELPLGFVGEGIEPAYNEGYPYRSLVILRKHRIIPVGWELAALYIKNFSGDTITLGNIVDQYDNPDSPFYKLIDPNWVLKSPENFCSLEGAGPMITRESVSRGQDVDDDGTFDDPGDERPELRITRASDYCADERSCLEENEDGSCKFYGYCTQDRTVFDFQGETCNPVYNSCQTYNTAAGASVSYLENTLDFEGCSADNAGCRWYCEDQDPNSSSWTCNQVSGERIYFDNDAESCPAGAAGCRRYIDTEPGSGTNLIPNSSFEVYTSDSAGRPYKPAGSHITNYLFSQVSTQDSLFGDASFLMQQGTARLNMSIETGRPVRGRTFTLSFYAKSCNALLAAFESNPPLTVSQGGGTAWERFSVTNTYSAGSQTTVNLNFARNGGLSNCAIDGLMLEENSAVSTYVAYEDSPSLFIKTPPSSFACTTSNANRPAECSNYTLTCSQAELGCELYKPTGFGADTPAIAGTQDYCPNECVGYNAYKQSISFFEPEKFPTYFIPDTAAQCTAAAAGCDEFTNLDALAQGGESKEYYQYLRQCVKPAAGSNCQTFFSWIGTDSTGYQLVTETLEAQVSGAPSIVNQAIAASLNLGNCANADDALNNPECRQYFDLNGNVHYAYHRLTRLCTDNCLPMRKTTSDQADCTATGGAWQAAESYCLYNAVVDQSLSCSAEVAGCREYAGNNANNVRTVFTDDFEDGNVAGWVLGNISTVSITPGGHSLRGFPFGLQAAVQLGGLFTNGTFEDGETYEISLWARTDGTTETLAVDTCGVSAASLVNCAANNAGGFDFGTVSSNTLTINSQWNKYTFGPFEYDEAQALSTFPTNPSLTQLAMIFVSPGNISNYFYLDNIQISKVQDNVYAIKDSWNTPLSCNNLLNDPYGASCSPNPPNVAPPVGQCNGTEQFPCVCSGPGVSGANVSQTPFHLGCSEYEVNNERVTLKSFTNLCSPEAIGCEALIDTQNSKTSYRNGYNLICDTTRPFISNPLLSRIGPNGECQVIVAGTTTEVIPVCTPASGETTCRFNVSYLDELDPRDYSTDGSSEIVPQDTITYIVNNPAMSCLSEEMGCRALGNPNLETKVNPNIRISQGGKTYYAQALSGSGDPVAIYTTSPSAAINSIGGINVAFTDEATMFVYIDETTGKPNLFFRNGKSPSGTAGRVQASLLNTSPSATVTLVDDPTDTMTVNPATGTGQLQWTWTPNLTDGGIIAFDPNERWQAELDLTQFDGLCAAPGYTSSNVACTSNTQCASATVGSHCAQNPYYTCTPGNPSHCQNGAIGPCVPAGTVAAPVCSRPVSWNFVSASGEKISLDTALTNNPLDNVIIEYNPTGFSVDGFNYKTDFILDQPDNYSQSLCTENTLWCAAFATAEGTQYFKDPRGNVCEWRKGNNDPSGKLKWYKKKTNESDPDVLCPVTSDKTIGQNGVSVDTPIGECIDGQACMQDSDCVIGSCTLFAATCPFSESSCREYIDPVSSFSNNVVFNGDFSQDVDNDNVPDGWLPVPDVSLEPAPGPGSGLQRYFDGAVLTALNGAANITQSSTGIGQSFKIYPVVLEPDTLYTISARVRRGVGAGNVLEHRPAHFAISECEAIDQGAINTSVLDVTTPDASVVTGVWPPLLATAQPPGGCVDALGTPADHVVLNIAADELDATDFKTFSGRFKTGADTSYSLTFGAIGNATTNDPARIGHWFDDIRVIKTGTYYNLADTIDKTSCNGTVNPDEGCVLFNERITDNQGNTISPLTYDSDVSYEAGGLSTICSNGAYGTLCDSNTIVQVRRDRECSEWLTCSSNVLTSQQGGGVSDQCLDLGLCQSIDPNTGECNRTVIRATTPTNITLGTPENPIELASHLSGYSKAGAQFRVDGQLAGTVEGFFPFDQMAQLGGSVEMENGNFEKYAQNGQPNAWTYKSTGVGWSPDKFAVIADPVTSQNELGVLNQKAPEGRSYLRVGSTFNATSDLIDVAAANSYLVTAWINTLNLDGNNAEIRIEEYNAQDVCQTCQNYNGVEFFQTAPASGMPYLGAGAGWTRVSAIYTVGANTTKVRLQLRAEGVNVLGASYYDDVVITPVLRVQDSLGSGTNSNEHEYCEARVDGSQECYIPPSCRLYAEDDALSCEYIDESGLITKGVAGYCIEHDPKNPNVCITWWPIDQVQGKGFDELNIGYSDRLPLYMCLGSTTVNQEYTIVHTPRYMCRVTGPQWQLFPSEIPGLVTKFSDITGVFWGNNNAAQPNGLHNISNRNNLNAYLCGWRPANPQNAPVSNGLGLNYYESGNIWARGGLVYGTAFDCTLVYNLGPVCLNGYPSTGDRDGAGIGQGAAFYMRNFPTSCSSIDDCGQGQICAEIIHSMGLNARNTTATNFPFQRDIWGERLVVFDLDAKDYYIEITSYNRPGGANQCSNIAPELIIGGAKNYCTDVAQVVTPSGRSTPWSGRVAQGSSFVVPGGATDINGDVNITLGSDYTPFGGIVPPKPVDFPEDWDSRANVCVIPGYTIATNGIPCVDSTDCNAAPYTQCGQDGDPLFVEAPDKENFDEPYQARAGTPYSCQEGWLCNIGKCLNEGSACTDNAECSFGLCCTHANTFGPNANPRCAVTNPLQENIHPLSYSASTDATTGSERVQRLFAKSYGSWTWSDIDKKYTPNGAIAWDIPQNLCGGNVRPAYDINNPTAELCGVAPTITNAGITSPASGAIDNTGFVTLSFNSSANFNQLPLKRLKVDWGDGTTSVVSGIRMQDRPNISEPHQFYHLYSYWDLKGKANLPSVNCAAGSATCTVSIRVQVQDNWGWCNATPATGSGVFGLFKNECDTENNYSGQSAWTTISQPLVVTE